MRVYYINIKPCENFTINKIATVAESEEHAKLKVLLAGYDIVDPALDKWIKYLLNQFN